VKVSLLLRTLDLPVTTKYKSQTRWHNKNLRIDIVVVTKKLSVIYSGNTVEELGVASSHSLLFCTTFFNMVLLL